MTSPVEFIKDKVDSLLQQTEDYHEYYHTLVNNFSKYEKKYQELVNRYANAEAEEDWNFERFRKILHRPYIAWPTLGVFAVAVIVWTFSLALGTGVILPQGYAAYPISSFFMEVPPESYPTCSLFVSVPLAFLCLVLSSVASYASFTVGHEAIHRSLSKNRWFNDLCGRCASLLLGPLANYNGMKKCHMLHHKYTNDKDKDPDHFVSVHGPGGAWLMPLRWLVVDVAYWYHYLPTVIPLTGSSSTKEKITAWVDTVAALLLCVYLAYFGYFGPILQYWIIPSRIALVILALAFDFLPHYPHETKVRDDRYHATSYLSTSFFIRPFFSVLILYQNYHIMHHLYPTVPFYRTELLWKGEKNKLLKERKVHVTRLFTCFGEELLPSSSSESTKEHQKKGLKGKTKSASEGPSAEQEKTSEATETQASSTASRKPKVE